jgi:uncharacterized protein YyaL (SSP411 family)
MKNKAQHTNALINESSPYLLQHAHNPVDWMPWGKEAFEKAERENKLVLVSIGYAACHWCHVMEHESFEDTTVAKLMNEHFVCIKVDREERPDVDEIYMTAVQLMTQRGGWPLNCFALPDGRPFYGGTYFQKGQWMDVLQSLYATYTEDPEKVYEYAENVSEGVRKATIIEVESTQNPFEIEVLDEMVVNWKRGFDNKDGGPNRAPKFPLPNNYQFLLRYGYLSKNKEILDHVKLSLNKMAWGGIYDQIGGGFARYATDMKWKIPHFEKMLYDNAQLISLYSEAYQATKDELYKEIVYQSIDFVNRELRNPMGGFYSSLDADSEGEEGKFYIWNEEELQSLLNDEEYQFIKKYYNINSKGYWENDHYILLRDESDASFSKANNLELDLVKEKRSSINEKLMKARDKRIRPGLDDKILTSWNGLMISALCDAYLSFGNLSFLKEAEEEMQFLLAKQWDDNGALMHSYKDGKSSINGFLEDYSTMIEALISLYTCTFKEAYLDKAKALTNYAIDHFYNEETKMFYFTSDLDDPLISRTYETNDNVIPASNSIMANNLFYLGHYFDNNDYLKTSDAMLNNVANKMHTYGPSYANWGNLMLHHSYPFYEVAISGKKLSSVNSELHTHYLPNKLVLGAEEASSLQLMEGKIGDKTMIYVCVNKACQLPVSTVNEAVKQIIY